MTIVAQDRLRLFGDVIEDEMHVNRAGAMAQIHHLIEGKDLVGVGCKADYDGK